MMKKFLRWNALLLALCCCLTAFALAEEEPVVITTSVDTLTVAVGRIVDYELSISPRSAKKGYTFTISDETVAEVLRDGRVKGRKQGTCTLTIGSKVDPTATKVLDVIVVQPAKSVKAQLDQETLSVGQTAQITASVSPEDATLQGVTYESRKPEVATVDENGVVTGMSRGSATIDQSGRLTATQAGKVLVYAEKAGDATYAAAKANPIEVTIQPAQLTICVQDKTAAVGEWAPSLSSADYTVSGLVNGDKLAKTPTLSYASAPDMSREGSVTIQASGAVAPVGGNYRADITYQFGTLTITPQPVYPITVRSALNGTVTADKQSATEGTSVTLTVKPNQNFKLEKLTATSGSKTLTCRETGSGTYAFTMPAGAVTVSATFAQIAQPVAFPFTDVSKSSWYYDSVAYVYAQGLMNGTGATTFAPATPTTRGMLVTILYRMEGSPASAAWSPFADVTADAYYAAPVAWAAWNGIVNGVSATKFAPKQWITREQMASILYRYARYKQWDVSQRGDLYQFSDRSKCHSYALEALSWANATGLIQGKGKDILDPRGLASRAQVAAILQRFHQTYAKPAQTPESGETAT